MHWFFVCSAVSLRPVSRGPFALNQSQRRTAREKSGHRARLPLSCLGRSPCSRFGAGGRLAILIIRCDRSTGRGAIGAGCVLDRASPVIGCSAAVYDAPERLWARAAHKTPDHSCRHAAMMIRYEDRAANRPGRHFRRLCVVGSTASATGCRSKRAAEIHQGTLHQVRVSNPDA